MQRIVILGTTAKNVALSSCKNDPDCQFTAVDSFERAREIVMGEKDCLLVVSRDFSGISNDDLTDLYRNSPISSMVWPPDSLVGPLIRSLLQDSLKDPVFCGGNMNQDQATHILLRENEELKSRIAALEGAVRSLISALSQYEPAAEAYADNEDIWEMILNTIPSAEINPENDSMADDYDGVYEE